MATAKALPMINGTANGADFKITGSGRMSTGLVEKSVQISQAMGTKFEVEVRGDYIWIMAKRHKMSLDHLLSLVKKNAKVRNIRWKGNKYRISKKSEGICWPSRSGVWGSSGSVKSHRPWDLTPGK